MAICRIYLCTYRRNHLLKRAVKSLLAQTFTDWVCELHNDDPGDSFPQKLVEEIAEPRISIVNHLENLGPTRTFNLIFQEVSEPFVSLLEDDNWWQPNFLEKMIEIMGKFPEVNVAWANMRVWQEESDGSWTDTGKSVWNRSETDAPELFYWPNKHQIGGALHSQGAMLIRSKYANNYLIPEQTSSAVVEHVRERAFQYPILLVPQCLANFAITAVTSRSKARGTWEQMQTLLTGSFFKHVPVKAETLGQIWQEARSKAPNSTGTLFFVALILPECRYLLKYATLGDWMFFSASCLKRPSIFFQILQSISSNQKLWNFLEQQTACRTEEARQRGFKGI